MRISDWSSDVCSSDLRRLPPGTIGRPDRRSRGVGRYGRNLETRAVMRVRGQGSWQARRTFPDRAGCCVQSSGSSKILGPVDPLARRADCSRSEEHTSELQSLMRISYAVFCLKKKKTTQ